MIKTKLIRNSYSNNWRILISIDSGFPCSERQMKSHKSKSQLGGPGLRNTASTHCFKLAEPPNLRKGSVIVSQTPSWNLYAANGPSQPALVNREVLAVQPNRESLLMGWKSERKRDNSKQIRPTEETLNENHIIPDSKSLKAAFKKKLRRNSGKRPNSLEKQHLEQKRSLTPPLPMEIQKPVKVQSLLNPTSLTTMTQTRDLLSQRAKHSTESSGVNVKQRIIPAQSSPRSNREPEGIVLNPHKLKSGVKVAKTKQMSLQVMQAETGIEPKRITTSKPEAVAGRRSQSINRKLLASTPPASPHQGPGEGLLTAISPLFKTQLQLHREHPLASQLSSCASTSSPFAETRTRATQGCSYNSGLSKQSPEYLKTIQSDLLSKKCVWHSSKQARFFTFLDHESLIGDFNLSMGSAQVDIGRSPHQLSQPNLGTTRIDSVTNKSSTHQVSDFEGSPGMHCISVCSICAVKLAQKGIRLEEIPLEQERHQEQQQVLYEFHQRTKLLIDLAGFVEKSLKAKAGVMQTHYKQQFEVLMASACQIDELYNKIQTQLAQINQTMIQESQIEGQNLSSARQNLKFQKVELTKLLTVLDKHSQEGLEVGDLESSQKQLSQYNEALLQIGEDCKRAFTSRTEVTSIQMCEITLGNIEAKFQDVLRCKRKELQLKTEEHTSGDTFLVTLERLESLGKSARTRLTLRSSYEQDRLIDAQHLDTGLLVNSLGGEVKDAPEGSDRSSPEGREIACLSFEGTSAKERVEFSGSKEYGDVLRRIDDNQSLNLHYYSSLMYDHASLPHPDIQTPELGGTKDQMPAYIQSHLQALLNQTHASQGAREGLNGTNLTGFTVTESIHSGITACYSQKDSMRINEPAHNMEAQTLEMSNVDQGNITKNKVSKTEPNGPVSAAVVPSMDRKETQKEGKST